MRPMQELGSLTLGVGELLVIHTPWVALCVVSSVDPTTRTVQRSMLAASVTAEKANLVDLGRSSSLWPLTISRFVLST